MGRTDQDRSRNLLPTSSTTTIRTTSLGLSTEGCSSEESVDGGAEEGSGCGQEEEVD
jgi:hypothetical protein